MQIGQGLKIFSKVVSTKPTKTHASQLGPLDNSLLTHSHHKGHLLTDSYANILNIKEYFGKIRLRNNLSVQGYNFSIIKI